MFRVRNLCKTYAKTQKLYPNPQFGLPHEVAEAEEKELAEWGNISSSDTDSVEPEKETFYSFYGWVKY